MAGVDEPDAAVGPADREGGRHATWLELFFDLMAVAGVAALAHLLHADVTWRGIGTYTVAFAAFWMIWAVYTTYGNIKGAQTHTGTMLAGMVALGVMTASVPRLDDGHSGAFAVAFVGARLLATRPWSRTTLVVDLPVIQGTATVLPWIASLWAPADARLWFWAVGLAADVWLLAGVTGERWLQRSQERLDAWHERARGGGRVRRRAGRSEHPRPGPWRRVREVPLRMTAATTDAEHLAERMGLFMLIVLGEGLVQIVDTAADVEWTAALQVSAVWAFVLLLGLWYVAVERGYAGIALAPVGVIPLRFTWLAHLIAAGSLVMAASMIGAAVARPDEPLESHERWVLLAAIGVYALLSVAVHAASGRWRAAALVGGPLTAAIVASAVWRDVPGYDTVGWLALGVLIGAADAAPRRRRRGLRGADASSSNPDQA